MKRLHNQSVVICIGFLALAMAPAQGCIFSSSVVGGDSSDTPDMATSLDMNMTPDLGSPPGDLGGEPLDFSTPDPDDSGGPGPADMEGACQSDADCVEMQQCVNGMCQECPASSVSPDVYCDDGTELIRCGQVNTGSTSNCTPATVQCLPCDTGTTCSVEEDSMNAGVCEPDPVSLCPDEGEVIRLCDDECGRLQYMCGLEGFVSDGECMAPGEVSALCTDASRTLTGSVSHIALGTDRVLVTRDALQSPVMYARIEAGGSWVRGGFSVPGMNALGNFLPPGLDLTITSVISQNVAVAMSDDDSVVALTVKIDLAEGSAASSTRNAVLVYRDDDTDALGGLELTQLILGEDEHFATSLSILDNRLAVGSPMTEQGAGRVSLYAIDVEQGPLPLQGECAGGLNQFGADVALSNFGGNYVVFATADEGVYTCVAGPEPVISPTSFEPNVGGPMAISASFNGLLISGDFPLAERARLYRVARNSQDGTITSTGNRVYAISHPDSGPVIAELHARNATDSSPQMVFNTPSGFNVARRNHTSPPDGSTLFVDYQSVLPIAPNSAYNVLAADANIEGDLVFAISGGGDMSRVFFANVPVVN